jgi:hypothetical protein
MTGSSEAERPGELTDAQLDILLNTANEELLDYVQQTADPSRTLTSIMAGSDAEAPARPASTPRQVWAARQISMRIYHRDLRAALMAVRRQAVDLTDVPPPGKRIATRLRRHLIWAFGFWSLALVSVLVPMNEHLIKFNVDNPTTDVGVFFVAIIICSALIGTLTVLGVLGLRGIPSVCFGSIAHGLTRLFRPDFGVRLFVLGRGIGLRRRVLERQDEREIALGFARARAWDGAVTGTLTVALDFLHHTSGPKHDPGYIDRAIRIADAIESVCHRLADHEAALHGIPLDASGADLSHVKIGADLSVLNGVIWTQQTTWPAETAADVRRQSEVIAEGLYQVRIGTANDRTDMTRV